MPANLNSPVWEQLCQIYSKQVPLTKFMDEISALKVTLVSSPNKESLYRLFKNVANVSFDKNWEDFEWDEGVEFLDKVITGGMLPLGLEMNNFTFLVENVTRITTHALVRGRVGMTYSQQSTGNSDQRHCDILLPRSLSTQNKKLLASTIQWTLAAKAQYSNAVDSGMSVQEARYFLPTSNANKIYLSMNLASMMNFFSKRSDRTEEYLQGNEICRQIKEIFNEKFSELSPILKSTCGKSCAHSKNSPFVNGVYFPSKEDDVFNWNPESFLYKATRDDMCWNETPLEEKYFLGIKEISKDSFDAELFRLRVR